MQKRRGRAPVDSSSEYEMILSLLPAADKVGTTQEEEEVEERAGPGAPPPRVRAPVRALVACADADDLPLNLLTAARAPAAEPLPRAPPPALCLSPAIDLSEPLERQVADASPHASRQAQRDTLAAASSAAKFDVLANVIEERVERHLLLLFVFMFAFV